ncbi:MAG TPA: hypothetical protein VN461_23370 [Vicinamibacteria bacterium]|nr:hypothetical protein [Vicinamibacteria bacterium]
MFESKERLASEIGGLLQSIRRLADGPYACLLEPKGIVFESADPDAGPWVLRRFLEQRSAALFRIPTSLASGEPMEDLFAAWTPREGVGDDEFFLAFMNGRIVLVVACPEAEPLQEGARKLIKALADRLVRYNATWRLDEKGRGFFFGGVKLDLVVVGRAEG